MKNFLTDTTLIPPSTRDEETSSRQLFSKEDFSTEVSN